MSIADYIMDQSKEQHSCYNKNLIVWVINQ